MKITRDPYIDANKVIEVGDCYFLSIKYWDEDKINNRFKTSGIPVIESDLYNPNRVSYSCGGIMNFEPIFLLDDPSLKDEIILTFDCFTYNSYPQTGITIHSEDSKKIKVNQH